MTSNPDRHNFRRFKLCTWGLVLFILLLCYPLSLGPWICYSNKLPAPVKRLGDEYYYAPIGAALASESFESTPPGKIYVRYLMWWMDIAWDDDF